MVRSRTVQIDTKKFISWAKSRHLTFKEISIEIGEYDSFISKVLKNGEFPERKYDLFCGIFGVKQTDFLPDKASTPSADFAGQTSGLPYSVQLSVHPDRVRVKILYQGEELCSAYSKLKGNTELDLIQGISYATHLCYKFAEQNILRRVGNDAP